MDTFKQIAMEVATIDEFLERDERKELLRLLTAGSVDDGKSTLIGRLLYDSKRLYEDQLQALERDSRRVGSAGEHIDYALLCDGLRAEREQGITIDVAYRYFSTNRRKFIIADTPGHEQYTRNMITGGSTANLAIILVDACRGVVTQTLRHSYIVSLLGIRHVVLAVNKMDLVGYSRERFESIVTQYRTWMDTQESHIDDLCCIPLSALEGENVVERSASMAWYDGPSLMEHLESVLIVNDTNLGSLRLPVQYVLRPDHTFRGFAAKIASGIVRQGDEVVALPSGRKSHIRDIVTYDGSLAEAFAPQSVVVTLEDEIDLSRGEMLVHVGDMPSVGHRIRAMVVWMDEQPLDRAKLFYLKHTTRETRARITSIHYRVDINRAERVATSSVRLNEIVELSIETTAPLMFDSYDHNRSTGAFILIDPMSNYTSAVGMIVGEDAPSCELSQRAVSLAEMGFVGEARSVVERFCNELRLRYGIDIELRG